MIGNNEKVTNRSDENINGKGWAGSDSGSGRYRQTRVKSAGCSLRWKGLTDADGQCGRRKLFCLLFHSRLSGFGFGALEEPSKELATVA